MHAAKISMPILCLAILSLALICSAVPIDSVHRPVYNTWGIPGNNVQDMMREKKKPIRFVVARVMKRDQRMNDEDVYEIESDKDIMMLPAPYLAPGLIASHLDRTRNNDNDLSNGFLGNRVILD